jgi:hypothetical protein
VRFGLHQGEGLGSVQAFGTGPLRVIRFNWTGSRLEARVLAGNAGRDLGRARVVADGQHHRHRVLGPGQADFMPLGLELVSRLAGGLDQRLQAGAAGPRNEGERPVRVLLEVAWLDGCREGADLECDRLGNGIDAGGATQGKAGVKFKTTLVRLAVQVDLELGVEVAEGLLPAGDLIICVGEGNRYRVKIQIAIALPVSVYVTPLVRLTFPLAITSRIPPTRTGPCAVWFITTGLPVLWAVIVKLTTVVSSVTLALNAALKLAGARS